jgi:2-polyprenyl-3-methyl-5-hydroxy-6-metoxy-1,4-benzoquinol methylase
MSDENKLPSYKDYARWKMSVNDWGEFFNLTDDEAKEIAAQFQTSGLDISNAKVLEIGFGSGKVLRWFHDNECSVEGVEIQEHLIQLAREKNFKAFRNISECDGPYDLIIGLDVLEHMTLDQLKDLFDHASQKLSPSGKMLFRFPNADSYAGLAAQNGDYTHITAIGQSKLRQIIEPHGFVIESFGGRVDYPVRSIRNFLIKIIRWPMIKIIGFGNPYFFDANLVAVIKRTSGER